jgi:hypothetical protein
MRHRRKWWPPWRRREPDPPSPPRVPDGPISDGTESTWALERMRGNRPAWTADTMPLPNARPDPPLMTRAATWRSRQGRW